METKTRCKAGFVVAKFLHHNTKKETQEPLF